MPSAVGLGGGGSVAILAADVATDEGAMVLAPGAAEVGEEAVGEV